MTQFAFTAGHAEPYRLLSAATVNNSLVKAGGAKLVGWVISNSNAAARYVKFYNKATAPAAGTDTPVLTLFVPPGAVITETDLDLGFSAGLGIATTVLGTDADTTVVAAGEIIVNLFYR